MTPSLLSLGRKASSKDFDDFLKLYASGAVAAGVSILALATPAEGKVVVTNTNITVGPGGFTLVDMNNDGVNDFAFGGSAGGYHDHTWYGSLAVFPIAGGKVVGGARKAAGPYASALTSGHKIGPSAHFSSSVAQGQLPLEFYGASQSGPTSYHSLIGPWGYVGSRYLGVRFLINGQIHYGWIRMSVGFANAGLFGNITEYAYETTANKVIEAGATTDSTNDLSADMGPKTAAQAGPALGLLALGADGLFAWRRRQDEQGKD